MLKILYVDDEANSEKFSSRKDLLEEHGITTKLVSSASEAVDILNQGLQEFDAVLLDIIMPTDQVFGLEETAGGTETGLRFLSRLREKNKDIPVVIVSVRRIEELGNVLAREGVSQYLPKSSTTNEIAEAIRAAISRSGK